jgi:hypothetical protein
MISEQQEAARADILAMLTDQDELTQTDCLAVYLRHYPRARENGSVLDRLDRFMGSMESCGLVRCSYAANGRFTGVRK